MRPDYLDFMRLDPDAFFLHLQDEQPHPPVRRSRRSVLTDKRSDQVKDPLTACAFVSGRADLPRASP